MACKKLDTQHNWWFVMAGGWWWFLWLPPEAQFSGCGISIYFDARILPLWNVWDGPTHLSSSCYMLISLVDLFHLRLVKLAASKRMQMVCHVHYAGNGIWQCLHQFLPLSAAYLWAAIVNGPVLWGQVGQAKTFPSIVGGSLTVWLTQFIIDIPQMTLDDSWLVNWKNIFRQPAWPTNAHESELFFLHTSLLWSMQNT